ncbi:MULTISPECIES: IclR family transcriptional regulator [unclassified Amycolatopsis]|uniref:IclR family transcriptional regulator n=1 Tax=unclassified Amycolatopsis TaxID=2618356 RepID=UPI001C6988A6|nr:IclR family transcriptional regulator [Amycolatopsis sp. DSM 110486]QYN20200.1 IclR family transcriptional regulator [Amycolatopsis sp. DSM 110486]
MTEAGNRSTTYRDKNSTADRALDILGMFATERLRIRSADVAGELGVARSTAYRYLSTLHRAGYLEDDPQGGFRLGQKVFELARLARSSYGLSAVALPIMERIAAEIGETVLLTRRSGAQVVCLEKAEPPENRVRLSYQRGTVLPLNAGASAWVLIAWEPPDECERLLAEHPFTELTSASVVSPSDVAARLGDIRNAGFAVTRGELDPDAIGIAAPIRDDQGKVVAGLSVVSINRRVPADRETELVEAVLKSAGELSTRIALVAN